ncbi:exosome complex component rrp40 [Anaeramoeba ignava]|uniref:Ribosomal RNA-processing protein 40 n=1 Tax=Anaeramoeba ignava TaxID=1746090 RepID=A0A9Q0R7H9_ANAIG|nr:exosome complex component rrp40 [Anaeramoeba ignava]
METQKVGQVILPGEIIGKIKSTSLKIGNGLNIEEDKVIATKGGILQYQEKDKYWISNFQKRYVPKMDHMVIGIIINQHGENYSVDIGSASRATLSIFGFEGATKKTRPNLENRSAVYARVIQADKDLETELICIDKRQKSSGFGPLDDQGYIFKCSLSLAESLLMNKTPVIKLLSNYIPFEIAIGINGRIWVKSEKPNHTIIIVNSIIQTEGTENETEISKIIKKNISVLL